MIHDKRVWRDMVVKNHYNDNFSKIKIFLSNLKIRITNFISALSNKKKLNIKVPVY